MLETKETAKVPMSEGIQTQLDSIQSKNAKARAWGGVAVVLIIIAIVIGVVGIYVQTAIARSNQKHIDCIVKLFTTPLPSNAHGRSISNPSTTCNINFSK